MDTEKTKGITLIEVLTVISVMALLMAILMSPLGAARSGSRALACKSNLRQLLLAGIGYATENDGAYVPAARDMWDNAGLHRWHGMRDTLDDPFDPLWHLSPQIQIEQPYRALEFNMSGDDVGGGAARDLAEDNEDRFSRVDVVANHLG